MPLHIDRLVFDEFRGYAHLDLAHLGHLTVFAGPNAVGKTNIVEGIQLLTSGSSFRKPSWSETVSWGSDQARLYARFVDGKRLVEHVMHVRGNERTYEVNGKRRSASALRGTCPSVLFIPDDLQLVKASSARRRQTADELGTQLSKAYSSLKSDYQQVVKQRNLLIHDGLLAGPLFDSWNESLALTGARLCCNRWKLVALLAAHMETIYADLVADERLAVRYVPSWERFDEGGRQMADDPELGDGDNSPIEVAAAQEILLDTLHRLRLVEERRKTSLAGPHKDDIAFFINGRNARLFASQGQQRTIVLAWKLAEVEVVGEVLGEEPVLLLDDVMSELDEGHRESLTDFVEHSAQTFLTTANLGYFSQDLLSRADVISVPIEGTRHVY